jgi:hypothetical protein
MTMKKENFSGWIANLSNGESVAEGSSEPGKLTPWRQMLERLENHEAKMTGLRLMHNGITIHALPMKQCDGYFHAYEMHRIMYAGTSKHLQGVGAIVDDKVFITWFEKDTGNIYQDVRPLEEVKIHTTRLT